MAPFCHARVPPRQKTSGTCLSGIHILCHARVSLSGIHVFIFLDSRQKIAGMTDGARDSRQKIAGMTFFCHARFIWGHVPIPSGFRYMSPVLCSYAKQVFLHATGVGKEHARGLFEGDDVEIAYGINKLHRVLQCR